MIDILLNFIAPHYCYNCQKIGELLCDSCKYNIIIARFSGCIACGKPAFNGICEYHAYPYKNAYVVSERKDALKHIIDDYKFQRLRSAYLILADLLHASLPPLDSDVIVTAVPTSRAHIRQRGYDHTLLIAKRFAQLRKLRFETTLSHKHNVSQHFLNRADRLKQAQNVFAILDNIDTKHEYLIIDDIFTTGSTIEAAARQLKMAGARSISIAIIARQPISLF